MPDADAQFYLDQPAQHVDSGTARVAYRRFGAGDPVMLVHGWPLSGFTYRKLLPRLAGRFTCYAVDLPGAGESEWKEDNDFSFHGHAEHLQRLARTLGLDAYRIIAHDTGATVARRLAVLEGERVRQMVLIDTEIPHHRPPLVPFLVKVMSLPGTATVFRWLLRSDRFLRSSAGFGGCFCDPALIDGDFRARFVDPLIDSARRLEGQIRYARGIHWAQLDALAEGHRQIPGPVLLIWGDQDPFFPVARAREMIPQFAQCAGLVEIPGTKLLPHEEKPAEVLRHVFDFFARNVAAASAP